MEDLQLKVDIVTIFSEGESEKGAMENVGNSLISYAKENGYLCYALGKVEAYKKDEKYVSTARVLFMGKRTPELMAFREARENRKDVGGIEGLFEKLKENHNVVSYPFQ